MYVVITGASRGIGKALAYKYASKGYDLVLTCENNIDILYNIKNDIEQKYNKKIVVKKGLIEDGDLTKDVKENLYMLINNAGKCLYKPFNDTSYEEYKIITFANMDTVFLTTKVISSYFIRNKQGLIINISSMWGIYGSSCETIYSMTKGGINVWTRALAKEYENINVDVIAFALGAVDTEMNSNLQGQEKEEFLKTLDKGKMWTAEEIADKIYEKVLYHQYNTGDIIEFNNGLK